MPKQTNEIDMYISGFPEDVREKLVQLRAIILKAAPKAEESISYKMPAYKTYGKPLVYFAGFKQHIGLYALPSGHAEFSKELSIYKSGKGSVQFPIDKPLPVSLIRRMVAFRLKENKLKWEKRATNVKKK
ncbi:MAG: DUF1801 domain-containing protein [Cyclobacteriaceae bacterium]|nr:DUF1801 domain-containing protein [Cyclobacteriaceae bacterium]